MERRNVVTYVVDSMLNILCAWLGGRGEILQTSLSGLMYYYYYYYYYSAIICSICNLYYEYTGKSLVSISYTNIHTIWKKQNL